MLMTANSNAEVQGGVIVEAAGHEAADFTEHAAGKTLQDVAALRHQKRTAQLCLTPSLLCFRLRPEQHTIEVAGVVGIGEEVEVLIEGRTADLVADVAQR